MESFYFVMDLACSLKLRKMEKHFCNDMNMMDDKHNQQFWLRSIVSNVVFDLCGFTAFCAVLESVSVLLGSYDMSCSCVAWVVEV